MKGLGGAAGLLSMITSATSFNERPRLHAGDEKEIMPLDIIRNTRHTSTNNKRRNQIQSRYATISGTSHPWLLINEVETKRHMILTIAGTRIRPPFD